MWVFVHYLYLKTYRICYYAVRLRTGIPSVWCAREGEFFSFFNLYLKDRICESSVTMQLGYPLSGGVLEKV